MARNPVKRAADKLTKPATHTDKKRASQRGYEKHRGETSPSSVEPSKPSHAYVDADMLLFAAASSGERIKYRYFHKGELVSEFGSAADGKNWIEEVKEFDLDVQFGFKGDVDELERFVDYEIGDLNTCKKNFNNMLKEWVRKSGCKKYTAYVSKGAGAMNFRYGIATIKPYKDKRSDLRKPHYLEQLRKHVHTLPNCKKAVGMIEVDDIVCAMAQRKGEMGVVVAGDKDARQASGCWILIPDEMEHPIFSDPLTVGRLYKAEHKSKVLGYGWLFLLQQILEGDKADTYGGCKGIGDTGAFAILEPFNDSPIEDLALVVNEVKKTFDKVYKNGYHYTNHHTGEDITATGKDVMIEMAQLAYMLKGKDDVCPLISMLENN